MKKPVICFAALLLAGGMLFGTTGCTSAEKCTRRLPLLQWFLPK